MSILKKLFSGSLQDSKNESYQNTKTSDFMDDFLGSLGKDAPGYTGDIRTPTSPTLAPRDPEQSYSAIEKGTFQEDLTDQEASLFEDPTDEDIQENDWNFIKGIDSK